MLAVQKWGNSQGVRLPKALLDMMGLKVGDPLQCDAREGEIVLKPKHRKVKRGKYTLEELLAKIDDSPGQEREIDWGRPKGREVW